MHRVVVSAWLVAAVTSVFAQVPESELAKPTANARHFIIQSTGGKHGDSWIWVAANGTRMGRESMNLRGQVFELDSEGKAGPVYGEFPNWPEHGGFEALISLPGSATSLSYSFI